ncbi:TetR/AcrR family transcriptional regulator [Nonomuraea sp. NPDC049695]|uniref:TetR/AcrR family transcriptional regulator n=1 Tax=Nonomuraea sp. NPDC049695 TaxID=3154734 RepID=UPI00342A3839
MEIKPLPRKRSERRRLGVANPEVRRRLLRAAIEIIQRDGWPALRIEDLARQAGLSVGTFYLYFEGKDDLFVSLVVTFTEHLQARLREAYADPQPLARALDIYLDFVAQTEPGFLHFLEAGNVQTTAGSLATWAIEQHANDLRPVLEQAMHRGELRQDDPQLTAHAIITLIQNTAAFWLAHKDTYTREQIKTFILTLITTGLAPPPDDPTPGAALI